jgi:hypothetical protein
MKVGQAAIGKDGAAVGAILEVHDGGMVRTMWTCEKWNEEQCKWAADALLDRGISEIEVETSGRLAKIPVSPDCMPSSVLLEVVGRPEEILVVEGNLLVNEGIQRLLDLLIAAGGASYNNAGAFIGVGDTATAAAATDTELLATQNAANRFYKGMVATYPQRTAQTVDWRSDFTATEANFVWNEWTIAAGATTASGAGFLVGTTNLNRKVQSLGTKATGTWTLTGSVTIS